MDKNKIHVDDWVKDSLSNEFDNEGIHQSWSKMSDLLDKNESKPKVPFWFGRGKFMLILISSLLASIAGIALFTQNDNMLTTQKEEINKNISSGITKNPITSDVSHPKNSLTDSDKPSMTTQSVNAGRHKAGHINPTEKDTRNNRSKPAPKQNTLAANSQNSQQNNLNQDKIVTGDKNLITKTLNQNIENNTLTEPQYVVSASNELPIKNQPQLKKHQLDSISNQLKHQIEEKQIAYSENNKNLGRVKEVKVTEKHITEDYPRAKDNDHTPEITTTVVKTYTAMRLMPLTPIEQFVLQSMPLEILESEHPDEDIRFLSVVNDYNKEYSTALGNKKSTSNIHKESTTSLLRDINNFFNFRKNFYTTTVMGFNSTPGLWLPLGFQAGLGFHYYISDRFTVGLEGIYNFRNSNFMVNDSKNTYTLLGTGTTGTSTYFNYEDLSIDREYNVKFLQSFQFPIMFNYHTPKFTLGAGPVIAFTSKIDYIKKDKQDIIERTIIGDNDESFPLTSSEFKFTGNEFNRNMLLGMNLNAQYNLNHQVAFTFRYAHLLWDKSNDNNTHDIMKETFKKPEFRIGIQYKLSKSRRVQYMMPTDK